MSTYHWSTDAAKGTIEAEDIDAALAQLVAEDEWSPIGSGTEDLDLANGAWLLIRSDDDPAEIRRGQVP